MAQFPDPIRGYPLQVGLPTGWTQQLAAGTVTYEVLANGETEYSDRALTFYNRSATKIATYDTPGVLTDCEVLALIKIVSPVANSKYGTVVLRQQDSANSGYFLAWNVSSGGVTADFTIRESSNSILTDVATGTFTWTANTWYWVRFRAQGTTLSGKMWAKGAAEPGAFQASGTNATWASGRVGVKSSFNDGYWYFANFWTASAGETASRGTTLDGSARLDVVSTFIAKPGVRWAANAAALPLTSGLSGRFTSAPIPISAVLAANALFSPQEWVPTRWQTPAPLALSSTVSVKAFIPYITKPRTYTGDHYQRRFGADYAEAFNNLLPTGIAWPRQATTTLQKVVTGLAGIWGNTIESLAELLLTKESDPRSTVILLPEWERAWGLPDKCLAEPLTVHDRQIALVNKMTMKGAQSREFFEQVAAKIGYTNIHIREWSPFMCGISMCGDTRKLFAVENVSTSKDVEPALAVSRTWFANGLAQIDVSQFKFGTSSLQLNPATKDCIYAPVHDDWELGGSDFTIQGFFNCTRAFNADWVGIIGQGHTALSSRSFDISRAATGASVPNVIQADLYTNTGSYIISGVTTFSNAVNTGWHHFRFVRRSRTAYLFIDGILEGQVALAVNTIVNNSDAPLTIGSYVDPVDTTVENTWGGWLDVVQFQVGIAQSVSSFQVPIEPPIADRYTRTLLNFEDVDGSQNFLETLPDPAAIPIVPTTPTIIAEESDTHYRWEIGPPEIRFYWSVSVNAVRYTWFRASSGQAGVNHHLEFGLATDLECILRRWKPAHTEIIFDYSPVLALDFSQVFDASFILIIY